VTGGVIGLAIVTRSDRRICPGHTTFLLHPGKVPNRSELALPDAFFLSVANWWLVGHSH
jgi:hypothetical protein